MMPIHLVMGLDGSLFLLFLYFLGFCLSVLFLYVCKLSRCFKFQKLYILHLSVTFLFYGTIFHCLRLILTPLYEYG